MMPRAASDIPMAVRLERERKERESRERTEGEKRERREREEEEKETEKERDEKGTHFEKLFLFFTHGAAEDRDYSRVRGEGGEEGEIFPESKAQKSGIFPLKHISLSLRRQ